MKTESCGERRPGVVHLHPTLKCNLRCRHCYSRSAPGAGGELDPDAVVGYLRYLRERHDFRILSLSGGEPFLYRGLEAVNAAARDMGYQIQGVTNGMLLGSRRNRQLLSTFDSLAVSVDGDRALHDSLRAQEGAYDRMLEGLQILRQEGIRFGLIHTLTRQSWTAIPRLLQLAQESGAGLLQLHALEAAGRAADELDGDAYLTEADLHRVYILAAVIRAEGTIRLQLDLAHREYLLAHPEAVFVGPDHAVDRADLFREVIIGESGRVLPISYGFSPDYLIDDIHGTNYRTTDPLADFIRARGKDLRSLINRTYEEVCHRDGQDIVNWSERLLQNSWRAFREGATVPQRIVLAE